MSWSDQQYERFLAGLWELQVPFTEVELLCYQRGWPHPEAMTEARRTALLRWLRGRAPGQT